MVFIKPIGDLVMAKYEIELIDTTKPKKSAKKKPKELNKEAKVYAEDVFKKLRLEFASKKDKAGRVRWPLGKSQAFKVPPKSDTSPFTRGEVIQALKYIVKQHKKTKLNWIITQKDADLVNVKQVSIEGAREWRKSIKERAAKARETRLAKKKGVDGEAPKKAPAPKKKPAKKE